MIAAMKGFYTQGGVLLLDENVSISELGAYVALFGSPQLVKGASVDRTLRGDSLVVSLGMGNNAAASIDVVHRPWPDSMGNPQTDSEVFAAWSMGDFGPLTWPGSLERAIGHAWAWPEGRDIAPRHAAFIRVKVSHVFGAGSDAPILPADYDSVEELYRTTDLLLALAEHPSVIAWFNPNGEVLLPPSEVVQKMQWAEEQEVNPVDVWTNVRMLKLDGIADDWMLMDTVGMGQADAADMEAFFPVSKSAPNEVVRFLRNASNYVINQGPVFNDLDTMDGPGGIRWQVKSWPESFYVPPRRTLRWLPYGEQPPSAILQEKSPLM